MKRAPALVLTGTVAGFAGIVGVHTISRTSALPAAAGASSTQSGSRAGSGPSAGPGAGNGGAAGPHRARTVAGPLVNFGYGTIAVRVTASGSRIVSVSVSALHTLEPTSQQISDQAIPVLRSEVLSAQSANINGVSGATYTSQGYDNSLQAALHKLRAG